MEKTYEVVFQVEVAASDENKAIEVARRAIANREAGVPVTTGTIHDGTHSDITSREINHVAVLGPKDRQRMEAILSELASSLKPLSEDERHKLHNEAINLICWPR